MEANDAQGDPSGPAGHAVGRDPRPTEATMRAYRLDWLRLVAVGLVLVNHGAQVLSGSDRLVSAPSRLLFAVLEPSVEWLFVLSGFLIGNILVRMMSAATSGPTLLRGFWIRRWARTIPGYLVFFGVAVALWAFGLAGAPPDWRGLLFLQSLAWPHVEPIFFPEAWTLAVDEWFYLLAPVALFAFWHAGQDRRRATLSACLVLLVAPLAWRALTYEPRPFDAWFSHDLVVVVAHLDVTAWGLLAAIIANARPRWWQWSPGPTAALGVLVTVASITWAGDLAWSGAHVPALFAAAYPSLLGIGAALVLPWLSSRQPRTRMRQALSSVAVDYTYAAYLANLPAMVVVLHVLGLEPGSAPQGPMLFGAILGWLALTGTAAWLLHVVVERPVLRVRDRITARVDASPPSPLPARSHT